VGIARCGLPKEASAPRYMISMNVPGNWDLPEMPRDDLRKPIGFFPDDSLPLAFDHNS
jgi:hypothetical protein